MFKSVAFFFIFSLFGVNSLATSIGSPATNVKAINSADAVVIGSLVSKHSEIQEFEGVSENGERVTNQEVVTLLEFLIDDSFDNPDLPVGSIVEIKMIGGVSGEFKTAYPLAIPTEGEQVVIGLQKNTSNDALITDNYTLNTPRIIKTGDDPHAIRSWVNKVRSADTEALNNMVKEEWKEVGYEYNAFNLQKDEQLNQTSMSEESLNIETHYVTVESNKEAINIINELEEDKNETALPQTVSAESKNLKYEISSAHKGARSNSIILKKVDENNSKKNISLYAWLTMGLIIFGALIVVKRKTG